MKKIMIMAMLTVGFTGVSYAGGMNNSDMQNDKASLVGAWINPSVNPDLQRITWKAIGALKDYDAYGLAQLVHPKIDLRFSAEAYLNKDNVKMSKDQLPDFFRDKKEYSWAKDMAGEPVKATPLAYYKRYIYPIDFIAFEQQFNKMEGIGNVLEFYPGAQTALFEYPGTEAMGYHDSRMLRLVFVEQSGKLYLAAIVYCEPEI